MGTLTEMMFAGSSRSGETAGKLQTLCREFSAAELEQNRVKTGVDLSAPSFFRYETTKALLNWL